MRPWGNLATLVHFGAGLCLAGTLGLAEIQRRGDEDDTLMVLVARRDLHPGVPITEDDLYAVPMSARSLPDGVFIAPTHALGRVPRERILADELVRAERLSHPGAGVGLNVVLPRGMRAISIELSDGGVLSELLSPGDHGDLLVRVPPDQAQDEPEIQPLLREVVVLGIPQGGPDLDSVVTLLVSADEAEQIAHAESRGEVILVLHDECCGAYPAPQPGIDVGDLRN
jgi:Flp pilus assembly protein CpaB